MLVQLDLETYHYYIYVELRWFQKWKIFKCDLGSFYSGWKFLVPRYTHIWSERYAHLGSSIKVEFFPCRVVAKWLQKSTSHGWKSWKYSTRIWFTKDSGPDETNPVGLNTSLTSIFTTSLKFGLQLNIRYWDFCGSLDFSGRGSFFGTCWQTILWPGRLELCNIHHWFY